MPETLRPDTEEQLIEAMAWAAADSVQLEIIGNGTKRALGNPIETEHILDLSGLWGITHYEPSELVMTARAGTSLSEIQHAISENNQGLAFEPIDFAPALGLEANYDGTSVGTIGGMIATGFAGPRRIKQGSVRDHTLGFRAVSGRGELFKSGGKVMKNVTGFDLSKLMAGSFGTLAVMSEVSFKVLPVAEKTRTVLIMSLGDNSAIQAMSTAMNSAFEVSSVAHLPEGVAKRSAIPRVADAGAAITAIRVEGPAPSVVARCEALRDLLGKFGDVEELHTANSRALWREIRDVNYFKADGYDVEDTSTLWQASVPPASGAAFARQVLSSCDGEALFDWGGGEVWLSLTNQDDAAQGFVRGAIAQCGGHATLIRASEGIRRAVNVFQPQDPVLSSLGKRVKESFDPRNILNPDRMY
ncbi:MAG: glycolate oxidase subunit GlcE [Rhodospirillales bacterium]|nr:glycolate oxidase subunit GlcE [Rhodospirillales bacterium]